jgi:hypothetical protein
MVRRRHSPTGHLTPWRLPEEIEADLNCQDPQRILAGLRDLKDCMEEFDEF